VSIHIQQGGRYRIGPIYWQRPQETIHHVLRVPSGQYNGFVFTINTMDHCGPSTITPPHQAFRWDLFGGEIHFPEFRRFVTFFFRVFRGEEGGRENNF
jgi:hypothetical protein